MTFLGLWIARFAAQRPLTKWHLVESQILDRHITKCGRQLGERPGTVVAPLVAPPSRDVACERCL